MRIERVDILTLGCRADGSNEAIVFVQLSMVFLIVENTTHRDMQRVMGDAASTYTCIILGWFVCLFTYLFCT